MVSVLVSKCAHGNIEAGAGDSGAVIEHEIAVRECAGTVVE
jgi:hypothetical protein